ncbi:MAG: hypothetical protein II382_03815 [Oscillospiraceae bacterium]|jgi:hypothetical protein|nr:hypothetical protein [Oscillospiraceae bacterium]MCR5552752.1 hypothetical protein [Oscillospiraceae bacterium]
MFRHGEISTEIDRGPFFFTLAALICCLTGAVLCFVLGGAALAVFAGVLLAIVAAAAFAVLLALVSDFAFIRDGVLHTRYFLKKRAIPLREIGKVTYREELYTVYDKKGTVLASVNGRLTGIDRILSELDRSGVLFE